MVRSSNPKKIFNDIEKSLGRAVIDVIDEINTIAIKETPVNTGYAKSRWRTVGRYKLGDTMKVIENNAPYIGILDGTEGKPTSKQAPSGMLNPKLNNNIRDITNRRRKL
jgi:hypothetical protein